jgi:hypothetical protein
MGIGADNWRSGRTARDRPLRFKTPKTILRSCEGCFKPGNVIFNAWRIGKARRIRVDRLGRVCVSTEAIRACQSSRQRQYKDNRSNSHAPVMSRFLKCRRTALIVLDLDFGNVTVAIFERAKYHR